MRDKYQVAYEAFRESLLKYKPTHEIEDQPYSIDEIPPPNLQDNITQNPSSGRSFIEAFKAAIDAVT